MTQSPKGTDFFMSDFFSYSIDRIQRSVLFANILRRRGNDYLGHLQAGQPPALVFDYETVMDAGTFDAPVNYMLVKIHDRRKSDDDRRYASRQTARPIVIICPRAGNGPGIGGHSLKSQIGIALNYGYPVYYIIFHSDPYPGQSIASVQQAEIRFLEEVARRHPDLSKPAVIGNCQAGWAAALIGADRPDLVGPMVFIGTPLSYWAGVEGANTLRYRVGLCGGVWLTSLYSDLGNGYFDGANLIASFCDLDPVEIYWTKFNELFKEIDTKEAAFLTSEKLKGGFCNFSDQEINI